VAKRRRKGTGSIRRVKGLYYPAYAVKTIDEAGNAVIVRHRPENPKSFRLKADAEAWLTTTRERFESCKVPAKLTLAMGIETMLDAKSGSVKPNTIERYRGTLKAARPHLERIAIMDCTPTLLAPFFPNLPVADTERPRTYELCRMLFRWLTDTDQLSQNPMRGLKSPKTEVAKPNPFTKDQCLELIRTTAGHRYESLFLVGLTTGMRPGEMFGLQWEDLNLVAGKVSIRRTLEEIRGKTRLKDCAKSASGNRTIALTPLAIEALERHASRSRRTGFVWMSARSTPILRCSFRQRHWVPLLKAASLPYRRMYELRHSAITLMLLEGIPIRLVSDIAGHSSADVTLRIYAHLLPGSQEEFVPRIDGIFREAASDKRKNERNSILEPCLN
jgi:integrase